MNRLAAVVFLALVAVAGTSLGQDSPRFSLPLFSGEHANHNDHFVVTGCEAKAKDGVLLAKEGNGFIRSQSRYRDFVLEVEYRALKKEMYDAGIYFRCELPPPGRPFPTQYQVNLKQGDELNLIRFPKAKSTGLVKPAGEWNTARLTVAGERAKMDINGKLAWETDGITAKDGYVGLQVEVPLGGQFEYRNISITELGYQPLFDGKSLAGWEGAGQPAEKCWKVDEEMIVCTGEKGPWLRSQEQYDDFNFRFDYKLKAGGNSGAYIRVPENGDHHGDEAGIEVQVLDDAAERYRTLKPYQYTGSLYAIAPATKHVAREAGEWNTLEINCRGMKYHVFHNGTLIISADETTFPELKGRLTKGHLGLQNHSEEVWFRHLRIGPALDLPVEPAEPAKLGASTIEELLKKPILEANTSQREVEAFCEARIVRLPADDAAERKSVEAWQKYAGELREKVLREVVFRGEAATWRDAPSRVEWLGIIDGDGYAIKKLRYEAVPGLWVPALLYEPAKLDGKAPVFLNVNGHDGKGKAAEYKQIRCINQAKRGIISLNLEWFNMGQLRTSGFTHYKLNQLDLCGTSGVGTFYLAMKRGLDVLLAHPNADPSRVGVAGLSGGGWQTIIISALDTRVTLANPVAGYSSYLTRVQHYSDLGDSEQTPCDLAATADYAHLTAMLAPRVALLTYNEKDNCCFAAPHALPPLLAAARPIYQLLGRADALHEHINYDPGTHNFERDNREAHYKVLGQHWFSGEAKFSVTEIDVAKDVKTAEELAVELPADNLDLEQLAKRLMQALPRGASPPTEAAGVASWQVERRGQLARVLRAGKHQRKTIDYNVTAQRGAQHKELHVQVTSWKLKIGGTWTVPAVEFAPPVPEKTAIVLADGGRAAAASQIEKLVAEGCRVIAIDPFYFGESKIKSKDFLFGLLVSSVGERPLGVQASQIGAVARWLSEERKLKNVQLIAAGPRTSLIALSAAALEDKAIAGVELTESRASLKELIEQGVGANTMPEAFCFGLFEVADIRELAMLIAPRSLKLHAPSDRAKAELASLKEWYALAGASHDPLAP